MGEHMYKVLNLKYLDILNINELNINSHCTVISGPSGCGKTTLVNLLRGTDYNYEGTIEFFDQDLKQYDFWDLQKQIISLPQESVLLGKTVKAEFEITTELLGLEYNENKIKQLLSLCKLDVKLNQETSKFSGGEKQRLMIARTLFVQRKLIIFDEPTSALDAKTSQLIVNNLKAYVNENDCYLIVISHDQIFLNDSDFTVVKLGGNNGY